MVHERGGDSGDPGRVELLEAKVRREKAARLEAERIAEQGLRDLYEANRMLDQRVAERTAELEQARYAALDAVRTKTEFLANMSHEVGTPLQTIVSAIELSRPSDPEARQRLEVASAAALSLAQLFRNLVELAQCEVGGLTVHPESTQLTEVADRLERRWTTRLTNDGKLLSPEGSGTAEIDSERLVQIGDLLLDNAARFAEPGLVRLEIRSDGAVVHLEVADSGPGVGTEDTERIFEPFVQLDGGTQRSTGGAGIGLSLARGLAGALGGTADAEANDHGGLTVAVRVPARSDPHARIGSEVIEPEDREVA